MSDELIQTLRDQRQALKHQIAQLEIEVNELNKQILKALKDEGIDTQTSDGLTTQIIQRHRDVYDWAAIKVKIGAVNWKSIIKEVPDLDLLTKAIAAGKIKASVISKHVKEEPLGEPHIKVDKAKREEVDS